MRRHLRAALCGALLMLVGACEGPIQPSFAAAPPAAARPVLAPEARPRLWYVGVALYGENWSENDVAQVATRLEQTADGFRVVPSVLSNRAESGPQRHPIASRDNIEQATAAIARRASAGDVVFLYVSTHGSPGLLARDLGGGGLEAVGTRELRAWLAPLGARPTVLVLSACFSGSLIPPLHADNRIIVTAARADRSSFGCRPDAEHSVFGEAFLDALDRPHESLRTIVEKTERDVAARERAMAVSRPSDPQVFVGPAVAALYDAAVF